MDKNRIYQAGCSIVLLLVFVLASFNSASAIPTVPDYLGKSQREVASFDRLLRAGQFQQAKETAEAKLKSDPNNPGLLVVLGYAEAGLKNWEAAIRRVEQAIGYMPPGKKAELHVDLGNIYALQGHLAQARKNYENVLAQNPQSTRALYSLGLLFLQTGEQEKALAKYQRVFQLDPRHDQAIKGMIGIHTQAGRYAEIIPLARQLQALNPNDELGYLFEAIALVRQEKPDYQGSLPLLKKALDNNPINKEVLYLLGFVLLRTGQAEDATIHLQKAIRVDPEFFEAHKLLAVLAMQQNDFSTAATHLEKALSIRESPELYQLLGKVRLRLGQREAGVEALTKSLEGTSLDEGEALATQGLYAYIGGDQEESERKLREALKKDPTLYETRILLIFDLLKRGRLQAAAGIIQEGVKHHPQEKKVLLTLLGQAQLRQGKASAAEQTLRRALLEDPAYPPAHLNLSAVYFQQGQYQKAEAALQQLLKGEPNDLQATILLSRVYQASEQPEKAEKLLLSRLAAEEPSHLTLLREKIQLYIRLNRFEPALQDADTVIASYPQSMLGYLLKARIYIAMKDLPQAFAAIDTVLSKSEENPAALVMGASLAFTNGQPEKSLKYLKRYQSRYRTTPVNLRHVYALDLIETGKYQEARTYIQDTLPQEDTRTLYLLGFSWIKEKDFKKAEGYLEQATQNGSRFEKAFFDLARVKLTLGKQAQAKDLLKKAIELNTRKARYYLALASVHQMAGEVDAAISVYEQGLASKATPTFLLNNLAILYLQKDDTQKAVSYANQALDLAPQNPHVLDTVGWVYLQTKEYDKAIPYLEQAARQAPDLTLFRYHLGVGYYEAGRLQEAKHELENAVSKSEKAPWVSQAKAVLSRIASR